MLKAIRNIGFAVIALAMFGANAQAADFSKPVKARQATMVLKGFYMGQLAAIAKGKVPYDAKKAQSAANGLLSMATLDGSAMWPPGSGTDKLGDATRAKPEIWSTYPAVAKAGKEHVVAATNMAKVAGNGLEAVQGAIGGLGKTCGGCHKPFRTKKK
ncbi:MAG: cytochrome c [Alphaproteobacteria bacterium]|nr:cytochrome c [Alphaproteobacteria bacterium]MBT4019630.1 cytochrome c [Alphaproteobacteria bacterium]MBT4967101.1 cytochrome c [Alphaproteobacteria bacterium]MBT5161781.1 cytochrome c [Alphaproteobacteria bacterium]MBT5918855.1 cytochrome c [Alphaproteobacteria bacterium]